jgi:GT2 family glycosyltransferase
MALLRATLRRTGISGLLPYAVSQLAVARGYLERCERCPVNADPADPRDLTVAIVSYNSVATIGDALSSLRRQTVTGFETIVVDSSFDGTSQLIREQFPEVRLLTFPRRLFPGAGRNITCEESKRDIIAFLDADCIAEPDWVENILRVHAPGPRPWPHDSRNDAPWIVGGSVGVANPRSTAGWGYFFSEFSLWLPAGHARPMRDIPTCTLSIKRTAFALIGPFLETGYCSDTAFNWTACEIGRQPWFDPRIRVRHHNPEQLSRILSKQRNHGETFARLRAERFRHPTGENIARALTAPLLPAYLWLRNGWWAIQAPGFSLPYLKSSPYTLLVLAAWSAGEATGYWKAARKPLAAAEAN